MLFTVIAKDFRRVLRNPWPWLLNLALPLAITAVIGFAFGGGGKKDANEIRIKFAVVDEDKSLLGGLLRTAVLQGDRAARLNPIFVDREEALETLRKNQISAIFVIPRDFTKNYLLGESGLKLEVIKNPAQSFMPAIIEELAGVMAAALNAVSRNLHAAFPEFRAAITNGINFGAIAEGARKVGARKVGARMTYAQEFLNPPLISYEKRHTEKETASAAQKDGGNVVATVFGYILPGMAAAFLLFIADQSMRDFHREIRMKTFDRQRTMGAGTALFIGGKILFTTATVAIGAFILFSGGGLIFGIDWARPGLLALACAAYSFFAAGFMACLTALAPSERRLDTVNPILLFGIAFVGGSYIPADNFPAFMRETITPWMPNHWLIETARALQRGDADMLRPLGVVGMLGALGIALGVIAALAINRRLTAGARA